MTKVKPPAGALAPALEAMMPTKSTTGRRSGTRRTSRAGTSRGRRKTTGRGRTTGRKTTTVREAGRRGGRRTLARKGSAFYREIGAKGGRTGGRRGGRKGGATVRKLVAAGKRASRSTGRTSR
jgi:hypothetical protein